MKKVYHFFCFFLISFFGSSQIYTWKQGANSCNPSGVYSVKGYADYVGYPGAREGSVTWTDQNGKLWLFGGEGYDAIGAFGLLNDLWNYDPQSGKWTWVHGSKFINQAGTYGTKGNADTLNVPGSRKAAVSWKDASGQLWLFGGFGHDTLFQGHLNDLWKFDIPSKSWIWMHGSMSINKKGIYGTRGVTGNSAFPGGRESSSACTSSDNVFYLFGGKDTNQHYHNDLWKFEPLSSKWTWLSGDSTTNALAVHNQQGLPNPANVPGARYGANVWIDGGNNVWLYGGFGFSWSATAGYLSELWKYDHNNDQWTWMKGVNTINQSSSYGALGQTAASNNPAGLRKRSLCWKDGAGNFWLLAGGDSSTFGFFGYNDLWKYDMSSSNWIWMKGTTVPNQYGSYGVQGTSSPFTNPGSRNGSACWTDASGGFWLLGGYGFSASGQSGHLNDLWKLEAGNSVGIHEQKNHSEFAAALYPNPCSGSFHFESAVFGEDVTLEIVNGIGQEVQKEKLQSEKTLIYTSLKTGLYFYTLKKDGNSLTQGKLLIN